MRRSTAVARCIVRAILENDKDRPRKSLLARLLALLAAFFSLHKVRLVKSNDNIFAELRRSTWHIDDSDYKDSFTNNDEAAKGHEALRTMGTMGYSGSTFFTTADQLYLIKSIPRRFEHSFFREDLLGPYAEHMAKHPDSALIRICDLLAAQSLTLGTAIGSTPSHHIVMQNLMHGQAEASRDGGPEWESWDLKPTSYFFPERDVASGRLASEATKSRLADKFDDKLILSDEHARDFVRIVERDTELLQGCNAVDYSLFLVRIRKGHENPFQDGVDPPSAPSWRTGIPSTDGQHVFRAAILDFFWAKHKVQPRLMTVLIKAYNMVDRQGPMSITTSAAEYRTRFLDMCRGLVEVSG